MHAMQPHTHTRTHTHSILVHSASTIIHTDDELLYRDGHTQIWRGARGQCPPTSPFAPYYKGTEISFTETLTNLLLLCNINYPINLRWLCPQTPCCLPSQ